MLTIKDAMNPKSDWDIDDLTPAQGERPDFCERQLWCAVLNQALYDSAHGNRKARHWLLQPGSSFALYAHFLNVNPHLIRRTIDGDRHVGRKLQIR